MVCWPPINKGDSLITATNALTSVPAEVSALLTHAMHALADKKGEDIVALPLTSQSSFADAFILVNGTSQRHIHTLAQAVVDQLTAQSVGIVGIEKSDSWVLVDAGDIVIHVFTPEARRHFGLDRMWHHTFSDGEDVVKVGEHPLPLRHAS